ncbi:hypothetical protein DPMN_109352 [Dreissena polymorpha]|uniref:Uncharacterized protein n=1 Tax=Dreissena polymorpha TaxID=45954 RepID=A0A9D4KAH4_DREPO|nr:hypothetical protein DPMN_109352 [Dreissena polymorpha]
MGSLLDFRARLSSLVSVVVPCLMSQRLLMQVVDYCPGYPLAPLCTGTPSAWNSRTNWGRTSTFPHRCVRSRR